MPLPKVKKDGSPSYAGLKYIARKRIFKLSPEQEIEAKRIADDLVTSLQLIVDDRLEESKYFRLYLHEEAEEIAIVKARILTLIKSSFSKMKQL